MDENELKKLITEKVITTWKEAKVIFNITQPFEVEIKFKLKGGCAGKALFNGESKPSVLNFNLVIAMKNTEDFLNDTVPHEVAHLVTHLIYGYVSAHGPEWKYVMIRLGKQPNRCHNMEFESARKINKPFDYTCKCGLSFHLTEREHNEMQHNKFTYHCKKCKGNLIYTGESIDYSDLL